MRSASLPSYAPDTMHAMAFTRHGARERPRLRELPIPEPGPRQLLVRLHAAGVGRWDLHERSGEFARRLDRATTFPHVTGSEGAGVVVCAGAEARGFREGERVYGFVAHRDPKGGCHAEFALFEHGFAWPMPPRLSFDQAAVLPVDGAIALRGLRDVLQARAGDALAVFGASGGIGHLALQLARNLGLRTLAIASGEDGVRLAQRLGADTAIDGRRRGVDRATAAFMRGAGDGRRLALLTAGGDAAARVVAAMPAGGRVAWPHGVEPPAIARDDVDAAGFGAGYDAALLRDLHALAERGPLVPHVSRRFPLERLPQALEAVTGHHLGRIAVLAA